jgi:hypothetical protein
MVNEHLVLLNADYPWLGGALNIYLPNQRTVWCVYDEANMSKLGRNDARQQYETPSDLSIPDFLRRAVAEAKLVIAEMDNAQAKMDTPKPA